MSGYVGYYRVSTKGQGVSGLGLEAQEDMVRNYVRRVGGELLWEYTEIDSGGNNHRVELDRAMAMCRSMGCTLVVGKLDRLSREVGFINDLMRGDVKFVCSDMPQANELTIHIMAAIAQHERKMISVRTKESLAVLKNRGVKLGIPKITRSGRLGADVSRENLRKRSYFVPAPDKISFLRRQKELGVSGDDLCRMACKEFGREYISKVTLWKWLK